MRKWLKGAGSAVVVLLASVATTAATPDRGEACVIDPSVPELSVPCGSRTTYYSSSAKTTVVGSITREPIVEGECNCEVYSWGTTSAYSTTVYFSVCIR